MMGKSSELLPTTVEASRPSSRRTKAATTLLFVTILVTQLYIFRESILNTIARSSIAAHHHHDSPKAHGCEQVAPLFPSPSAKLDEAFTFLSSDAFRNASILRHSGAVQLVTESFDDMGPVGEDPRWDVFPPFADYLAATFPRVHAALELEKVNTHGLLYTWPGSSQDLKPLLLLSHQDVVPVAASTIDDWTHPPYSGFYDGTSIWGRGSTDCKNQLIAVMETVEELLGAGFEPKRTVILSFGFDEEIGGGQGAGHLAPVLLERYGRDGIAALVDEGAGFSDVWGLTAAQPGVGEKGMMDVEVTIRMPGGHSSIPGDHTSIGVMAELLTKIEAEQYPTYLADENPVLALLQCGAQFAPKFPKSIKKLLKERDAGRSKTCKKHDRLAIEVAKMGGPSTRYLMQTSQAIDVISGGVKTNALPERVTTTINHRINIGDTPATVRDRLTQLGKHVAKKHNLTTHAFDGIKEAAHSISLFAGEKTLPVAPVTPTNTEGVTPYSLVAGTTRAIFGEQIVVSPGLMTGNTDTKYFWDVTKHIFRYSPGYDPDSDQDWIGNIHTVNEHNTVAHHISMVKWFTLFVRNMDDADLTVG